MLRERPTNPTSRCLRGRCMDRSNHLQLNTAIWWMPLMNIGDGPGQWYGYGIPLSMHGWVTLFPTNSAELPDHFEQEADSTRLCRFLFSSR